MVSLGSAILVMARSTTTVSVVVPAMMLATAKIAHPPISWPRRLHTAPTPANSATRPTTLTMTLVWLDITAMTAETSARIASPVHTWLARDYCFAGCVDASTIGIP
jgi:hypothetical protein